MLEVKEVESKNKNKQATIRGTDRRGKNRKKRRKQCNVLEEKMKKKKKKKICKLIAAFLQFYLSVD